MTKPAPRAPRAPRASRKPAAAPLGVTLPSAEQLDAEVAAAQAEEAANLAAEAAALAEEAANPTKTRYEGPMLALRAASAKGAYKKQLNGQPACGDALSLLLGTLKPEGVIAACIAALALPANPYSHLNIGQQSMNLRNKLRGALKRGEFGMGVVVEAAEEAAETHRA